MPSMREQVLNNLHQKLDTLATSQITICRNPDKPQKVEGGLIIMRDGSAEEPDVLLSPLTYIYQQLVNIEVIVQNVDSGARDSLLDSILVSIGGIINANRSLDGLAEWVEANAPAFIDEPIEGAASLKAAQFTIMIRFFTSDPLN